MLTRRQFLKRGAATGAGLLFTQQVAWARLLAAGTGIPLPGSAIPQFIEPLPLLSVSGGPMETVIAGTDEITLTMREFEAAALPLGFTLPNGDTYDGTWSWGYRHGDEPTDPAGTHIGPVIVASRGTATRIRYVNNLTADHVDWRDWTDQTLHWADPLGDGVGDSHYQGPIPAVAHLHGGEVPPVVDGGPDAWFTSDGGHQGHAYYTDASVTAAGNEAVYVYPNTQEAAPL